MRRRPLRWLLFGAGLLGTLLLVVPTVRGCLDEASDGILETDYSRRAPSRAFQDIFKRPAPAGVTDLRAIGMKWIGGANVWLRYRAKRGTLAEILQGFSSTGTVGGPDLSKSDIWHPTRLGFDPAERLEWDQLYRAKRIETYSRGEPGMNSVEVYVDRSSDTVYLFEFGI
ncbi:MAG: hypothetical protein ACK47B_28805 [Armatimonadota bacterium]